MKEGNPDHWLDEGEFGSRRKSGMREINDGVGGWR